MEKEKTQRKTKKQNIDSKNKFNIKAYFRSFLLFVDKKLLKTISILLVVSILLIAISIGPMLTSANLAGCEGKCMDKFTFITDFTSKMQILIFTLVAGIVPYVYISILGFVGYVLNDVANLAFLIRDYGYFGGVALGIIPLILNILTICILTSLTIYICRTVTVGYRISSIKNMNFMNFRIKFYETLQMKQKVELLTKKKQDKLSKLENKKEKLKYLQILNISIIVCIMQFISVLIQHILI